MKKILITLAILGISLPGFAITEGKLPRKCRKHPEKCQIVPTTPVLEQQMTLGIVQKDIKIGTSQAEVAAILGAPNIVTQDAEGQETWIYDKVSSIASYNNSGFGVSLGGVGGGYGGHGFGGGIMGVGYGKNEGTSQTVQKTLTVVIKFDEAKNVSKFTYHMSTF